MPVTLCRAFLTYDILKRWLQYCGYDVEHVCNLTDVDDKIMKKMEAESMTLQQVTDKYTNAFFEDLEVTHVTHRFRLKTPEHL
jgi:cysteinyl-tRNA synthetase